MKDYSLFLNNVLVIIKYLNVENIISVGKVCIAYLFKLRLAKDYSVILKALKIYSYIRV